MIHKSIFLKLSIVAAVFMFVATKTLSAQSLNHPVIWVTEAERVQIVEKTKKYDWAKSMLDQLHARVDEKLKNHQINPSTILDAIPAFAKHDHENLEEKSGPIAAGHNKVLTLASESGMLYYLTQDEKYAQFAADILAVYINELATRTPQTTTICGYYFFDPRTTYGPFAITYDFIYNFLKKEGTKVYDKELGKRIIFDQAKAQKAVTNIARNALADYGQPDTHGKFISNHPILTATGALFSILCIEDDAERKRLFNIFWEKGTDRQNSFKHTILPMFGEQGIWPESTSYSFMPIITLTLNIIDRIYPEMNVTKDANHILEGNFLFDYLRYPDRGFVRFGDSKGRNDQTIDLYQYTLYIAQRRGYKDLEEKAKAALSQGYAAKGGYSPKINDQIFNNFDALELFWGVDIPKKETSINFNKPTVIIKHAGVALQRNFVEKDNKTYGLCGIIGGAHYVHSHLTGISMELYGAGHIMAPNAALPPSVAQRQVPEHEQYFRLYAGNNTVVVNGTSHGRDEGSWKGKANVWQNTTINIAAEPRHLEDPISKDFSFATQFLKDEINHSDQQRTLGIIRTSEQTAYYFDMFRSKSLIENKFHDYIYHNIGDRTFLTSNGEELDLKETDKYKNDIGDIVKSPGWRFFENIKTSTPIAEALNAQFQLDNGNKAMNMFIPAGNEREYTKALAPPTREATNGYLDKKTQVLVIRQHGEAWEKPFMAVFEPTANSNSSIKSVENLMDGEKVVGAIVSSKINDSQITDYIISQDKPNSSYVNDKLNLKFDGRYAIVRVKEQQKKKTISLYIGEGKYLQYGKEIINADTDSKAFKEKTY